MGKYYRGQRTRNIFDPKASKPFKLSRSKIELFMQCPRCFYLDRRLGVGQPPGFPFNLNSAVDALLKKEFDLHRTEGKRHALCEQAGIEAIPFAHPLIEVWRDSLHAGIQHHHQPTNLIISGGVDDVWITPQGELIIVDYKATSKKTAVTINEDWQVGYKRQMSLYAWLFVMNGFNVHPTGYFVYCNGKTDRDAFDKRLEFDISLLPYQIDFSWVEPAIAALSDCLRSDSVPPYSDDCDYCTYTQALLALKHG